MSNKDQVLLESLYTTIKENDMYDMARQDPREGVTDHELNSLEARDSEQNDFKSAQDILLKALELENPNVTKDPNLLDSDEFKMHVDSIQAALDHDTNEANDLAQRCAKDLVHKAGAHENSPQIPESKSLDDVYSMIMEKTR
jgi:hypothetical protein